MKILLIYCTNFSYSTGTKNLDEIPEKDESKIFEELIVAFIQVESHDQENEKSSEKKLLNFLKWGARKNETKNILLHSFAHLSEDKADASFTKDLFDKVENRLTNTDYVANQTPFGYFLNLNIEAPGHSQARIFKSF